MSLQLRPLNAIHMEQLRIWRNAVPETLRTPYLLTEEMQADYYRTVICDRRGATRYWGLWDRRETEAGGLLRYTFVGYGGIENIQWENRAGEISVLIGPEFRHKGYGREAVEAFLREAFETINLDTIWGECFMCSPAVRFWQQIGERYNGWSVELPRRKYWAGRYWGSLYFTFTREAWMERREAISEAWKERES